MKWLLRTMEKARPLFEEGGKLHAAKPVFEATENFFFAPIARTSHATHVRDPLDVKRFMSMVIIALAPCVAAAFYFYGLRVLAMIVVSYSVGGTVETIFAIVRKEDINEGFLVTGLIFPLILPPGLPLWMVGVGVAFGVLVGKELFGGTGRNLFNPALLGRCFLALSYPAAMSSSWIKAGWGGWGRLTEYSVDAVSAATPLAAAQSGDYEPITNLLFGNTYGSVGETFALGIIGGGIFLLFTRVGNWRTVAGTLGSFAILAAILNHVEPGRFGPVEWHLCAGGLLFGTFFMATDPVTSPVTAPGKWAYGIIIGIVTVLIRNFTGYVEGMMFAVLMGNICAPILDEVVIRCRLRRLASEG